MNTEKKLRRLVSGAIRLCVEDGESTSFEPKEKTIVDDMQFLRSLVLLAIMDEREACAKACEDNATDLTEGDWDSACTNCAYHIRARSNT